MVVGLSKQILAAEVADSCFSFLSPSRAAVTIDYYQVEMLL
jgi:hypothetical protein